MWKYGKRSTFRKRTSDCKCNHPPECHYTKTGNCVYQACTCQAFESKGRQMFPNVREACTLGHSHDSGLERKVCFDLANLKAAGEIKDFKSHPRMELFGPSGAVVGTYVVDFVVAHNDGAIEYIEAKGRHLMNLPPWPLKWALLQDRFKSDPLVKFRVVTE